MLCTECGLAPSSQVHHEPPLSERRGGSDTDTRLMRGVCAPCHRKLTGQLQPRLPPREQNEREETRPVPLPARPRSGKLPWVLEGAIAMPLTGPVEVHHRDGTVTVVETGERYIPRGDR